MMAFFANLFGYILNFIYNIIGNYGISIIVFSIIIKVAMFPISIKQQKTMKKSAKMQQKMKEIQFKYKNDPEGLNRETMRLYKEENMSPFSGCFSAIIQLILLLSIFYLVRSPLTYMRKIDTSTIERYQTIVKEAQLSTTSNYPEIDIIREISKIRTLERDDIKQEELDNMEINMNFLGLDLSQIPSQNTSDWKVYILPIIYVIVAYLSMKITMVMQKTNKKDDVKLIKENNNDKESGEEREDMMTAMSQVNGNMSKVFPILYLSVALLAPLGLALYWLLNSILMIGERLLLNKIIKDEEN